MENFSCDTMTDFLGVGKSFCNNNDQSDPHNIASMLQFPPEFQPLVLPTITFMTAVMNELISRKFSKSVEQDGVQPAHQVVLPKLVVPVASTPVVPDAPSSVVSDSPKVTGQDELSPGSPRLPADFLAQLSSHIKAGSKADKKSQESQPRETETPNPVVPDASNPVVPNVSNPVVSDVPKAPPPPPNFLEQLKSITQGGPKLVKNTQPPLTETGESSPTTDPSSPSTGEVKRLSIISDDSIKAGLKMLKKSPPKEQKKTPAQEPPKFLNTLKPSSQRRPKLNEMTSVDENNSEPISNVTLRRHSAAANIQTLRDHSTTSPSPSSPESGGNGSPFGNRVKRRESLRFDDSDCKVNQSLSMEPKLMERLNRQIEKENVGPQAANVFTFDDKKGAESTEVLVPIKIPSLTSTSDLETKIKTEVNASHQRSGKGYRRGSLPLDKPLSDEFENMDPKLRKRLLEQDRKAREGLEPSITVQPSRPVNEFELKSADLKDKPMILTKPIKPLGPKLRNSCSDNKMLPVIPEPVIPNVDTANVSDAPFNIGSEPLDKTPKSDCKLMKPSFTKKPSVGEKPKSNIEPSVKPELVSNSNPLSTTKLEAETTVTTKQSDSKATPTKADPDGKATSSTTLSEATPTAKQSVPQTTPTTMPTNVPEMSSPSPTNPKNPEDSDTEIFVSCPNSPDLTSSRTSPINPVSVSNNPVPGPPPPPPMPSTITLVPTDASCGSTAEFKQRNGQVTGSQSPAANANLLAAIRNGVTLKKSSDQSPVKSEVKVDKGLGQEGNISQAIQNALANRAKCWADSSDSEDEVLDNDNPSEDEEWGD